MFSEDWVLLFARISCRNGTHQNATAENIIARRGTCRLSVLPNHAKTYRYHLWPSPTSRRLVKPNKVREATYRLVAAQERHVNTRNALNTSAKCGILEILAIATNAALFEGPVQPASTSSESQLSRGRAQLARSISNVATNPLIV